MFCAASSRSCWEAGAAERFQVRVPDHEVPRVHVVWEIDLRVLEPADAAPAPGRVRVGEVEDRRPLHRPVPVDVRDREPAQQRVAVEAVVRLARVEVRHVEAGVVRLHEGRRRPASPRVVPAVHEDFEHLLERRFRVDRAARLVAVRAVVRRLLKDEHVGLHRGDDARQRRPAVKALGLGRGRADPVLDVPRHHAQVRGVVLPPVPLLRVEGERRGAGRERQECGRGAGHPGSSVFEAGAGASRPRRRG